MTRMRSIFRQLLSALAAVAWFPGVTMLTGCSSKPAPYGTEHVLSLPNQRKAVWAIAPAVNLSGEREVDPLLQADLLYQHLQAVRGLTVIPVNRVIEAYAGLRIDGVQSAEQANLVCDLLGCDGLVVPTVTAYDPYDPPKFGASVQVFRKPGHYTRAVAIDVRDLARAATPGESESLPQPAAQGAGGFVQAVGVFDAANGSVREALLGYAKGRYDPVGPMGYREYVQSMDRYVGFAYHSLIEDLLRAVDRADRPAKVAGRG